MLIRTLLSWELFLLGWRALRAHKLRSFLTALGMIFGVGAVICMLSIGEGASAEQMESIRLLGSHNIIIRSTEPPASQQANDANTSVLTYGITRDDVTRLRGLPHVKDIVLMREVADTMTYVSRKFEGSVLGTTDNFFGVVNVQVARGRSLAATDSRYRHKVCVIGAEAARGLFGHEDPLGRNVTVLSRSTGPIPYEVVGVLQDVQTAGSPAKGLGARDVNRDLYIPLATETQRYGDLKVKWTRGSREIKRIQLSDVYLHVDQQENVLAAARQAQRILQHGHREADYAVVVPLELLQQAERSKRTWQIVLGSIAGISLLVGGIGIMNIMLASVTERTREIGIRRALGAKRYHITAQFLVETMILSISGGVIGIIMGIGFAWLVTWFVDWQTIVPWWGVGLSFAVSALVGISFGLYPARAAAGLDPIEALRYE
ncbi:MAG: ABC transporter permease [Planctomycetes bacterium]|nr:ABC transporter permease [Planctomycetota bacterium]